MNIKAAKKMVKTEGVVLPVALISSLPTKNGKKVFLKR